MPNTCMHTATYHLFHRTVNYHLLYVGLQIQVGHLWQDWTLCGSYGLLRLFQGDHLWQQKS